MGEVGVETGLAGWLGQCIDEDTRIARQVGRGDDPATSVHQQNWSPTRVLAECDTKRKLIEMFPTSAPKMEYGGFAGFESRDCGEHRTVGPHRAWCHDCNEWCYPGEPCARCHGVSPALRLMAAVYSDRPGYREEWKP